MTAIGKSGKGEYYRINGSRFYFFINTLHVIEIPDNPHLKGV
jgi:hypothetical protein